MANLMEDAKRQVAENRAEKLEEEKVNDEKIKGMVSEYIQEAIANNNSAVSEQIKEALSDNNSAISEQIKEAVSAAVKEAMAAKEGAADTSEANAQLEEQVNKIYTEMTEHFQKQQEMVNAINTASDSNKNFLSDIQERMDKQTETSVKLVEQMQQKDSALMTIDYVAIKDNVTEFKEAIESCNQSMDQLKKQLTRERNNNDRTITELYRSMKYSEEKVTELHDSYDEFTTVISSHKNIMKILVWLDIVIVAALILFNVIQLL